MSNRPSKHHLSRPTLEAGYWFYGDRKYLPLETAWKAYASDLEAEVERLQKALDLLHGRQFSERLYLALHARMVAAEADRDSWKEEFQRMANRD